MNLNDLAHFAELDKSNMRTHLDALPDQVEAAWVHGQSLPLPTMYKRVERIVIAAMGDAAVAGEILTALVADMCNLPIIVNRSYELPAFADGQSTLVILICHDGDTEEVLHAAELADARGTKLLAITQGGRLASYVENAGGVVWNYSYPGPQRAAFGWIVGLLTALVVRMGLVRDMAKDVTEAVELMRRHVGVLGIDSPVVKNPAKRLAGQMIGRIPIVYGSGITLPVAKRWKMQLNNNGKTVAQYEEMPDLDHNVVTGTSYPKPLMVKVALIFLVAAQTDHKRVVQRWDATREAYLEEGLASDTVKARGTSKLAQMLSTVQFGDYVSYYVAMAYEVDPTDTPLITEIQEKLKQES